MRRRGEELIETLEENQVVLQNLITSKFIAHFLGEVSAWQKKLMMADAVISVWFEGTLLKLCYLSIFNLLNLLIYSSTYMDTFRKHFHEL